MRADRGVAGAASWSRHIAAAASALAQTPEAFFKGRQITFLVGAGAGGGYDVYFRTFARYLVHHIPGAPTIVNKNMPAASGLAAANTLYTSADKDGATIGAFPNNIPMDTLFGNPGARYDAQKLNWLGSIGKLENVCATWITSPIKTIAQAREREVIVAAAAATSNSAIMPKVLNALLGTRFKIVSGYDPGSGMTLALESGETEGVCGLSWSTMKAARPHWIKDNKLNVIVQMGLAKLPELPDVPSALELVSDPVKHQVLELILMRQEIGRPVAAPPGVPAERLEVLRRAFDETMRDPGVPGRGREAPAGDRALERARDRRAARQRLRDPEADRGAGRRADRAVGAEVAKAYRFASISSRRGASGEPNSLAFSYQLRAFSMSAPMPFTPIFASTTGSKVAPNARAAAALPDSAARRYTSRAATRSPEATNCSPCCMRSLMDSASSSRTGGRTARDRIGRRARRRHGRLDLGARRAIGPGRRLGDQLVPGRDHRVVGFRLAGPQLVLGERKLARRDQSRSQRCERGLMRRLRRGGRIRQDVPDREIIGDRRRDHARQQRRAAARADCRGAGASAAAAAGARARARAAPEPR